MFEITISSFTLPKYQFENLFFFLQLPFYTTEKPIQIAVVFWWVVRNVHARPVTVGQSSKKNTPEVAL